MTSRIVRTPKVSFDSTGEIRVAGAGGSIGGAGGVTMIGSFVLNRNLETDIIDSQGMERTLSELVTMATEYAINLAPVRDGDLVGSINGSVEGSGTSKQGYVEVGTDHWMFVEYGTGVRGAGSDQPNPGLPGGYVHGSVAGQLAQPFMRTTLWWIRNQVGD